MSELRQNLATREWVVIAPERLKGEPLQSTLNPLLDQVPPHDAHCPFCPGNTDERFEHPIEVVPDPAGGWRVVCIENLYKIVAMIPGGEHERGEFVQDGIYFKRAGCGNHELVIESNRHNGSFATMTQEEISAVMQIYLKRFNALRDGNLLTVIFKNHGIRSGASQRHPHSQIVGMRVVPNFIRFLLEQAQNYFDSHGICVFCKIVEYELATKTRLVYENDQFVALVPFASYVPYEVQILPKKHDPLFSDMSADELLAFSDCLARTMHKLYVTLSNPDFNMILRNPPYALSQVPFYHWHLQIVPYVRSPGGFELGSRIQVNVVRPEEAAAHLRNAPV